MGLRKGRSLLYIKSFLRKEVGPNAWGELLAALDEADRGVVSSMTPEGWYDLSLHARVTRVFCDVFYDGNLVAAEGLGRHAAEGDVALGRWTPRLIRPSFAIKNIDIYWRQDEDHGHWTTELKGKEVTATLAGWDGCDSVLCRRLLGYIGRAMENFGPVTGGQVQLVRRGGALDCVLKFTWHVEHDTPLGARLSSKEEIPEVGEELAQFPDMDSLSDAIVTLLSYHVGCPYVELWLQSSPERKAPVRTAGTKRGNPTTRLQLQTVGHVVGWLVIELGPEVRQDLLEELTPWLTLTLDAARLSSQRPGPEEYFARRLLEARTRWGLTARETEVLELLVRGERNKGIAATLKCEVGTVEQHVTHTLRKSGAEGRNALSWAFWMKL